MKNSDHFSQSNKGAKAASRIAATLFFALATTMAFAQEPYTFMEGSTHRFSVTPGDVNNALAWSMYVDPYNFVDMPAGSYSIDDPASANVAVTFTDMDRLVTELVYLVVAETSPNGCSTRRAIQINIEPNNMFLEFAMAETQECFNMGEYNAQLKVGLNFKDKAAGVPIPETRFPITVKYTIQDLTHKGAILEGNGGEALVLEYNEANDYYLLISEAVGSISETTEYELKITEVKDKYMASIKQNNGDVRLQLRIINHLPQNGPMEMAIAWLGEE